MIAVEERINVDVNNEAVKYGTALQAALCRGHTEVVRILLAAGAYVNIEARHYSTAPHGASAYGNPEIV